MGDLAEELTELVERLDTGILRFDGAGRCTRANGAATVLFGSDAIARASWMDLVDVEDQPIARAAHLRMVEEGRADIEVRAVGADGRGFDAEITLLRAPGEVFTGHHQIVRDATERRSHDRRIDALTTELARRDRDFDELLSMAAHELAEPVRKVSAFADLIRDGSADRLDETGRDYIERIRRAAARMDRVLRDLVAFARVPTSIVPLAPTDLGEAARAALSRVETGGDALHVEIGELPTVDADAFQMEQLFACLLSNAIRFHEPGQAVTVRVSASAGAPDGVARIAVADEGIGFEQGDEARVFRPFERLHGRTPTSGSGLGLAIARAIVARHGGTIVAEGAPGEGATFTVTLPVRRPLPAPAVAPMRT